MSEKIVGILGGMGPDATIDLFEKIVSATPAAENEDHLRIIIDNNPKLPDRQNAILRGGPSPVPAMIESGKLLQRAGADFLIIGANTAHWFHGGMQKGLDIPVLHIIEETVAYVKKTYPATRKVGILATSGAMKTGMFPAEFAKAGIESVVPDGLDQDKVMSSIMDFKHTRNMGSTQSNLLEVAQSLAQRGAELIIMGCTEIPIFMKGADSPLIFIDPNTILADVVVRYAKNGEIPVSARVDR